MASQEIREAYEKFNDDGKINSYLDAFICGCIYQIEKDTDSMLQKINDIFKEDKK